MYISEFACGVLATLAVGFVVIVGIIAYCATHPNDQNGKG